ncbi:MAG: haloacid dehalogenase-like hydrolase [Lachnospiraceae bacterium]|nr:haloacid dehalogenase-like hydrolase [Lachnospiraceae bacterium]
MNVYDFDGTIYRGDSTVDFFAYCIKRYPWLVLYVPYQLIVIMAYKVGLCSKECEKSAFFSFLRVIPDVRTVVMQFWETHRGKMEDWYYAVQKEDDVVISASPRFLLSPICSELGVRNLIASEVDCKTGRFNTLNCYGEEKVKRFYELFPHGNVDAFYSDSCSDRPMTLLAKRSYLVKKGKITKWDNI